ncbi:(2Fe-2S)-binding protein [Zwartia panacis]|uniref:(2Fe-2S)-binding protein n=1 Tax=Zwartia panacis TaxID=2683345 RepID=UPI0025B5952B|nr:2Fe-2S iron-sulfur cluster-binding protein [Zwartia panacis]MDN4016546.1 2Fe-2S iron-sulfur cluster-binding protein [Zwartia panacis]
MTQINIQLKVNGKDVQGQANADISLADFLHEKLGLTGTKVSCGIGICKACTVAVSASGDQGLQRMQACLMPAVGLQGMNIMTVEGLSSGDVLSVQQQALLSHFSFQCGYCTPGFLMGITLLMDQLKRNPVKYSDLNQTVMDSMGDHLCRCSGYGKYHDAIKEVLMNTQGLVIR